MCVGNRAWPVDGNKFNRMSRGMPENCFADFLEDPDVGCTPKIYGGLCELGQRQTGRFADATQQLPCLPALCGKALLTFEAAEVSDHMSPNVVINFMRAAGGYAVGIQARHAGEEP